MFIGHKSRKIDYKNRLVLPPDWRSESYVLVIDEDIELYHLEHWLEKFSNEENKKIKKEFATKSYYIVPEVDGRILLPKILPFKRKEIDLIGMVDYIVLEESSE